MSVSVEKYQELKRKADKLKEEADRAQGKLDAAMTKLQTEFHCDSLEAAKQLLGMLEQEEREAETLYNQKLAEFNEEWGEELNGSG